MTQEQSFITEEDLRTELLRKNVYSGIPLRTLASVYGEPVTHGDLSRIIRKNYFPKDPSKRKALGLSPLVSIEIPMDKRKMCELPDCFNVFYYLPANKRCCCRQHSRKLYRLKKKGLIT